MSVIVNPTVTDRMLAAFRALLRAEDPNRSYRGVWEYVVANVASDGSSADVAPADTSLSLPPILRVPLRGGIAGESAKLTPGKTCLISFVNGDPTRPFIFSAAVPQKTTIDATLEVDVGPSAPIVNIAGGSGFLVLASWATGLATALGAFASALASATTIGNVAAAGTALGTALGALPSPSTVKTKAT